ncbi:major facilitator superfamily transporter [Colletotrichum tofieldiae]|uniref:Major facilitator superfamily transporter n=1 Tax=Colletotrichum tofieldiae TaxID=708197 RepID=A0A166VHY5_9PEZI|nr:major facilitator superfamily transporter [Colletotrichum tofieldiae]
MFPHSGPINTVDCWRLNHPSPTSESWSHHSKVDILLNATTAVHVRKSHNADGIDAILCAVILLCAGSAGLWIIPATRQVEDIVCRQHYGVLEPNDGDTPINEDRCKENAIQSKVAMVFAIYSALQATLAAASAVPWELEVHGRPSVIYDRKPQLPYDRRVDDEEDRAVAGDVALAIWLCNHGFYYPPHPGDAAGGGVDKYLCG